MATLAQIRAKYPEYKDMPDETLVENIYQKDYSDMPRKDFYAKIDYTPPTQTAEAVRGFGAGAATPFVDLSNLINRGLSELPGAQYLPKQLLGQLRTPKWGTGTAYNVGEQFGQIAPLLAGGAELEGARLGLEGAAEAPEMASSLAKYLGTKAGRAITTPAAFAGYGAVTTPEDRTRGAIRGAEYGMGAEELALAGKPAGKVLEKIGNFLGKYSEKTQAAKLLDDLGGTGKVSLNFKDQFNAERAAEELQGALSGKLTDVQKIYNPVFEEVGDKEIYAPGEGLFGRKIERPYLDANYDLTGDLKETHDKFVANPTFQNAHTLQSDLGKEYASAKFDYTKDKTSANEKAMSTLFKARNTLKSDMDSFLTNYDKTGVLKGQYDKATQAFRKEVVPYLTDKKIAEVATGKVTYPKSLSNLFSFPGSKKEGVDHIEKIMSDLGDPFKNRIVYDELNKAEKKPSGFKVIDLYKNLGTKGLGNYITPSLRDQMETLTKLTEHSGMTKKGMGMLAGLELFHPFGGTASMIGALLGLRSEPAIERGLSALFGQGVAPKSMFLKKGIEGIEGAGQQAPETVPLANLYRLISAGLTTNLPKKNEEQ